MVILCGSYARGDWKNGPHEQGRGRLIIHKRSDYDISADLAADYCSELKGTLPRQKEILVGGKTQTESLIISLGVALPILAEGMQKNTQPFD